MEFFADDSKVKVLGRTLVRDGVRYLDYSCAAIEFIFTGKRAEVTLWTDSPSLDPILKAWVAVFVNGENTPSKRFALEETEKTYVIYEGSTLGETKIRLVKYSEVAFGKVGIKALWVDGDDVRPTPVRERTLEFIGDSITCGYGNEGIFNVDVFHTAQENPWDAYAAITARELEADYHLISWSGIGIISNWTDQDVPNDGWLMPAMYPYTDKATDLALGKEEPELWDSSRFVPDCIVINLGTNDSSYTKKIPERVETFGKEYYKFVTMVRSMNPSSRILCTLGAMGQDLCGEVEHQVELLNREGDRQIYYMTFDLQSEKDGIGSDWHPSKITHRKMEDKLVNKVKEVMNW